MRWASFDTASLSSAGGREHNEDSCAFLARGKINFWVLADGLGGHQGGETASRIAVDTLMASFRQDSDVNVSAGTLARYLDRANQAVLDRQRAEPELQTMRTTIVALLASPDHAVWAHAGDSRLYRFTGKLCLRTKDHSVPQRLADAGEIRDDEIRFHEDRNRLLKSLGSRGETGAEFGEADRPPRAGDAFLLASDGFWEWLSEEEMAADLHVSWNSKKWLKKMQDRIQERASAGHDNYSAIGIQVRRTLRWK